MRPDDGRAIPTFIRQALAGEPLTVAGDGSQTRSVCYVGAAGCSGDSEYW
jgi:dTDP-glucose 4,6-dehydratase